MHKLADLIDEHRDELSTLESMDNGKPKLLAELMDINFTIGVIRYYADYADKIHGETLPCNGPYLSYTKKDPVGVCG